MPNEFDQFDQGGGVATASSPALPSSNEFDQFDAPKTAPVPAPPAPTSNEFDRFDAPKTSGALPVVVDAPSAQPGAAATPAPSPKPAQVENPLNERFEAAPPEPGIIARSLTGLRNMLSPLIGETRTQTLRREQQQMAMERDMPGVAALARESAGPKGDTLQREGFVPAMATAAFTPAPGTPQLPMKKTAADAGKVSQIAAGTYNVGASVINSFASPGGAALMMGGAPAKIMQAIMTPILAKHAIENAMPTIGILRDPNATVRQKTEAVGNEVLSGVGAFAGGRGMLKDAQGAPVPTSPAETGPTPANIEPAQPTAPAKYAYRDAANLDEMKAGQASVKFYHLIDDIPGHPKGSTVSADTLTKAGYVLPDETATLKPLPVEADIAYKGRDFPVVKGVGRPVDQWQVKLPGEEGRGRTLTADQLREEGYQPPEPTETMAMAGNLQAGRIDPRTLGALARTSAGAALGYYSGDTQEEKIRNAMIGGAVALGAPRMLKFMRGEWPTDAQASAEEQRAETLGDRPQASGLRPEASAAAPQKPLAGTGETLPTEAGPKPVGLAPKMVPGTGQLAARGFVESVQASPDLTPETKGLVSGIYEKQSQSDVKAFAGNLIDALVEQYPTTGLEQAKRAFLASADSPTAESWAVGLELARRFDAAKDFTQSADVLSHVASQATTPARALAFLGTLDHTSSEGIGLYIAKMAKQAGLDMKNIIIPHARIRELQKAAQAAGTPETKLARQAELFEYVNDLIPTKLGQKLSRGLPLALIFHTKVFVKKALGDTAQMVLRGTADNIVPAFDKAFSIVTGQGRTRTWVSAADQLKGLAQPVVDFSQGFKDARSQGQPILPSAAEGAKTMFTLARLAARSSFFDNGTSDIRTALRHTYSNPVLRGAETLVSTGMGLPTRAAYMRAFQSRLANEMRAAKLNGAELVSPSDDMIDRAHLAGMEATFSHDNPFSKALSEIRKPLNFWQPIGIGSAIAPLTKVPGGMVDMAVRYSPIGFVRAAYKGGLAKVLGHPEAVDRGAALDAFTQAAVGTVGLAGTGYWLAKNGVITGAAEENADAEAVRRAAGFGKYSINLTALKRMMITGHWDTPQRALPGDITMPYNWAQPIGLGLATGAELYHQGQEASRAQIKKGLLSRASGLYQGLAGTAKSVEDMDLFQGMTRFGGDIQNYGLIGGAGLQALNLPAMYVPSIFRDARNLQDNTVRQLAVSDKIETATNRFIERIPYFADRMGYAPARDRFGEAVKRYDIGGNGWANVLLNPTYFSTVKADPVGKEVLRLWSNSGDTAALPKAVPMSMEIHNAQGEKQQVQLTTQQISDLQHWEGNLTKQFYMAIMHNPKYLNLPDDERSKVLGQIQTAVHGAGKMMILGDVPPGPGGKGYRAPSKIEQTVMAAALKSAQLSGMTLRGPMMQRMRAK